MSSVGFLNQNMFNVRQRLYVTMKGCAQAAVPLLWFHTVYKLPKLLLLVSSVLQTVKSVSSRILQTVSHKWLQTRPEHLWSMFGCFTGPMMAPSHLNSKSVYIQSKAFISFKESVKRRGFMQVVP